MKMGAIIAAVPVFSYSIHTVCFTGKPGLIALGTTSHDLRFGEPLRSKV
jgi:hypothetical protein